MKRGQGGLLLEVSYYSGDVLILATGTVSRSALGHRECGFYIHCFLLIFCSSSFFFSFSQLPSHSLPLSSFSPTHGQTHTHTPRQASASPERLVLDVHTVVSQSDGAEGKQRLWVRLRGARADATSKTLTDLLKNGKCCDNPRLGTKSWKKGRFFLHRVTTLSII